MRKNIKLNWCWIKPHHTTPKKFENAALFLRLGIPSTLIRRENGAFWKCFSNWRNSKMLALCFSVDGKHFENEAFQKWWHYGSRDISLPKFYPNTNPQWTVIVAFFKFFHHNHDSLVSLMISAPILCALDS